MANKPADHRSISSGKDLPNHRTVAAGLSHEASLAVKEVCLKYGVPSPPSESNEAAQDWMPNSVLDALAKYISLTRLESRKHKDRLRLLNVLSSNCMRVRESLEKLDHRDRRAIASGEDIDVERISLDVLVIGIAARKLVGEANPDKKINPQRFLIGDLVKEWRAARADRPVAYRRGGGALYAGEFYDFLCNVMEAAEEKPPHGDTIKDALKAMK